MTGKITYKILKPFLLFLRNDKIDSSIMKEYFTAKAIKLLITLKYIKTI
jgi:hypothetical protein